MACRVVGHRAVPLGQAAVPTMALSLCAACGKHPTPFKGPAEDVREERRQNPEPFQMLHPMDSVSCKCGATEAFLQVCSSYAEHQRHFQK